MVSEAQHTLASRRMRGFTLIELLVVIAIIGVLAALLFPAVKNGLDAAKRTREVACARSLVMGVHNYAFDNDGAIIPGYYNGRAAKPDGTPIPYPESARYPWRLMPYIGSSDSRVIWANPSGGTGRVIDESSESYAVSVSPSLGMNVFFVGGDESGVSGQGIRPIPSHFDRFGRFCVTRMDECEQPSLQIVFASARMPGQNGGTVPGYYMIRAPRIVGSTWSSASFSEDSAPGDYGYVDLRWNGRAVAAMLDGHVELLDEDQLRDMRRWSRLAALANDPDHSL